MRVREGREVSRMTVANSHCDHYFHANNARYADFFFDCFSMDELSSRLVTAFQIVYVRQAKMCIRDSSYTASYDALVAQYLSYSLKIAFPKTLTVTYEKTQDMLYGENPHQRAAVYREPLLKEGSIARAKQLAGAALTYNNIHDANAALELIKEFDEPAVVACKHAVPCLSLIHIF